MVRPKAADAREAALAAKPELLAQVRLDNTDFTNRSLWEVGLSEQTIAGDDQPVYPIANWVVKHLFTYEYLDAYDPALFSGAERAELDEWFAAAGGWFLSVAKHTWTSYSRTGTGTATR